MLPYYSWELCPPHSKRPVCTIETYNIYTNTCMLFYTCSEWVRNSCQICPKRFPTSKLFFSSLTLQDLGLWVPLCCLPPNMSSLIGSTYRIGCTRADCDGRMLSKQHNFQEKRCCVAELALQNSFVLSYISTTNISITINAFSDTLSGSSSSDKNVLVRKQHPEIIKAWILYGQFCNTAPFLLEIVLFREHSLITVSPCATYSLGAAYQRGHT